jgi:2-polyprenyl-6-hydroxyphenyl methylase/3-demethylubiquinone-9 3-methyltransferase
MKLPAREGPDWSDTWRLSFKYDQLELGPPDPEHLGYQYAYWARRDATLSLIERTVPPPARILDVAAAQGNFSLALAERGYRVTWNDLRGDLAEYTRLKHERGQVDYLAGNVLEMSGEKTWDVVVACEVIEHVAHPDRFLAQLATLVNPGGHIVITTPNGGYFRNTLPRFDRCPDPSVFESVQFRPDSDGHIFLLHLDELRALARKAGLQLVTHEIITNPLTGGRLRLGSFLPFVPRRAVDALERLTRTLPDRLASRLMTTTVALLRRD